MPTAIYPMLATSVEDPFDNPDWFFEIKWDGYRAIAFLEKGNVRLVSRNQNDLTGQYSDLQDMAKYVNAKTAILDGEVIALDDQGNSSFSLMQQRTGFRDRTGASRRSATFPSCITRSICCMPMATICAAPRSKTARRYWLRC